MSGVALQTIEKLLALEAAYAAVGGEGRWGLDPEDLET